MSRWLTTQEVAAELGVSSETVRRLIHLRRLHAQVLLLRDRRTTFRISGEALAEFRRRYIRDSIRDDWE